MSGITRYLSDIRHEIDTPLAVIFYNRILAYNTSKLGNYETRTPTCLATLLDPRYNSRAFTKWENYEEAKKSFTAAYANIVLKDASASRSSPTNTSNTSSDSSVPRKYVHEFDD